MQIRTSQNIFFLLLIGSIIFSCNKRVNNEITPAERIIIPKFGAENTLDVASWNIEHFGISTPPDNRDVNLQITDVVDIIKDLAIDLYAVQEIDSKSAFDSVKKKLEDYDGYLADFSSFLRTGIIYNESIITVINDTLLFDNDDDFPRPPLMLFLEARQGSQIFDFYLIVIHLKAFGDPESVNKRRDAILKMEQFINTRLQQGSDPDYIIAGDWNDELDDSTQNVFVPFLNKPQQYVFLTQPFTKTEYTYIGGSFESLIDHIMVTASIDTAYNIETQVIKIDQFFNQYLSEVSDHRPVAARIHAF